MKVLFILFVCQVLTILRARILIFSDFFENQRYIGNFVECRIFLEFLNLVYFP